MYNQLHLNIIHFSNIKTCFFSYKKKIEYDVRHCSLQVGYQQHGNGENICGFKTKNKLGMCEIQEGAADKQFSVAKLTVQFIMEKYYKTKNVGWSDGTKMELFGQNQAEWM